MPIHLLSASGYFIIFLPFVLLIAGHQLGAPYLSAAVVRWGDPVLPGAPAFDFENQTADAQARQFGYNCDYVFCCPWICCVYDL